MVVALLIELEFSSQLPCQETTTWKSSSRRSWARTYMIPSPQWNKINDNCWGSVLSLHPWVQVIKQVVKLGSRHLYPLTPLASLFPSSSDPLFRLKHKYSTWFLLTLAKKFRITRRKLTFLPVYWNKKVNNYTPFIMGKKKIHVRYANIFLFTKSSKDQRDRKKRETTV